MKNSRRLSCTTPLLAAACTVAGALGPTDLTGQIVPIRTVPVATGDQFLLHPSSTPGLGGLQFVVEDTIGAPFRNPSFLVRSDEGFFYGAPAHYGISSSTWGDGLGSGTTLPLGVLFRSGEWGGGVGFALQELSAASAVTNVVPLPAWDFCLECARIAPIVLEPTLSDASSRNVYLDGRVARSVGEGRGGVGLAVSWAALQWVAGVEHLYAGSQRIDPEGDIVDIRAGGFWESEDGVLYEAALVHNRVDMRHDVSYLDWPPIPVDHDPSVPWVAQPILRVETNRDVTRTWGAHVRSSRPFGDAGWRLGWSATANRRSHPKIPDYEIQNIPRDPGTSWAFRLGGGVSRDFGPMRFGVEALLEPIQADTWQEADSARTDAAGRPIGVGDKTILNDFAFLNVLLRSGVEARMGATTAQLGVQAHSIDYELEQVDRIAGTVRDQHESWLEWTPTWSLAYALEGATIRYSGSALVGTGQPGVARAWEFADAPLAAMDAGGLALLAAPSGPLTLQSARVWTHQISLVVPLR